MLLFLCQAIICIVQLDPGKTKLNCYQHTVHFSRETGVYKMCLILFRLSVLRAINECLMVIISKLKHLIFRQHPTGNRHGVSSVFCQTAKQWLNRIAGDFNHPPFCMATFCLWWVDNVTAEHDICILIIVTFLETFLIHVNVFTYYNWQN